MVAARENSVLKQRKFVLKLMSFPLESQNDSTIFHVELYLHRMAKKLNENKENNYKMNTYKRQYKQFSQNNQYRRSYGNTNNSNNEFISFNWVIGNAMDIVDFINGNDWNDSNNDNSDDFKYYGNDSKNSFDNLLGFMMECRIKILKLYFGYSYEFIICNETEQRYHTNANPPQVTYHNGGKGKDEDKDKDKDGEKQLKFRFGWQLSSNQII